MLRGAAVRCRGHRNRGTKKRRRANSGIWDHSGQSALHRASAAYAVSPAANVPDVEPRARRRQVGVAVVHMFPHITNVLRARRSTSVHKNRRIDQSMISGTTKACNGHEPKPLVIAEGGKKKKKKKEKAHEGRENKKEHECNPYHAQGISAKKWLLLLIRGR